jgi:8-oxo-dGTP diphosphatase
MKLVVAALMLRDGKLLICQRTKYQTLPLKWEFPGGKVEPGEQLVEALKREIEEELGVLPHVGDEMARIRHTYKNGGAVDLRFFLVEQWEGEVENRIFRDIQWAPLDALPSYDFLDADLSLVRDLAAGKIL